MSDTQLEANKIQSQIYDLMHARKCYLNNIGLRNLYYREYRRHINTYSGVNAENEIEVVPVNEKYKKFLEYKQLTDVGSKAQYGKKIFALREKYLSVIGTTLEKRIKQIVNECRERCATIITYYTSAQKTREIIGDHIRNIKRTEPKEIRYELFANYNIIEELYSTVFLVSTNDCKLITRELSLGTYDSICITPNKMISIYGTNIQKISTLEILDKIGGLSAVADHYRGCSKITNCRIECIESAAYLIMS